MKKNLFLLLVVIAVSSIIISCGKEKTDLNLDSNLFGRWVYTDSYGDINAWTFYDDGTCIQTAYSEDYDWLWQIEDSKLKLYVENGTPTYKIYKIEGDKLYFYVDVDQVGDWSLPYIKQ